MWQPHKHWHGRSTMMAVRRLRPFTSFTVEHRAFKEGSSSIILETPFSSCHPKKSANLIQRRIKAVRRGSRGRFVKRTITYFCSSMRVRDGAGSKSVLGCSADMICARSPCGTDSTIFWSVSGEFLVLVEVVFISYKWGLCYYTHHLIATDD